MAGALWVRRACVGVMVVGVLAAGLSWGTPSASARPGSPSPSVAPLVCSAGSMHGSWPDIAHGTRSYVKVHVPAGSRVEMRLRATGTKTGGGTATGGFHRGIANLDGSGENGAGLSFGFAPPGPAAIGSGDLLTRPGSASLPIATERDVLVYFYTQASGWNLTRFDWRLD